MSRLRDSIDRVRTALSAFSPWRLHLPALTAVAGLLIFPPRIQDEPVAAVVSLLIVLAGVATGLGWQRSALERKPKA